MEHYIITITRQFGSMGRPIGMKLAELLGIEFYDRDIVEEAANRMNISLSEVSDTEEKERNGFFYMSRPLAGNNLEMKERLFEVQQNIITEWAHKSSCVMVGRCSDYILRNEKNHVNFFIYAPYEQRLKNCVEELGMSQKEAVKMIHDVDKARNAYHKRYTRFAQQDLNYNHLMVDSSMLGIEGTAEALADIARRKFQLDGRKVEK